MSAHTPGPWSLGKKGKSTRHIDAKAGPVSWYSFAKVYVEVDERRSEAGEANARLIAAAPELLDALQAIVKSLADHDDEGIVEHAEPMIAARAAIQKATQP